MGLLIIRPPTYRLSCDRANCFAELTGVVEWAVLDKARQAGWQLRPTRGKGSRSAPYLCPAHRTEESR